MYMFDNMKNSKIKNIDFNKRVKEKRIEENAEIEKLTRAYNEIRPENITSFEDFPLCRKTLDGLRFAKYSTPTDIQRESIGLALQSNDILGAAKTGSGKTLAFLIPILECLYRLRWTKFDGMGALIISPTRELAYQTFEVLKKIGRFHDFSAGLVIGGKHLKEESECIAQTNIVICTPGRLLQHMDQTADFNADNLQTLVLDEADRILDLGFQETMNAIIANLPSTRQTLLFSATQTKSVKDLARLSLKNPLYVSVHEKSQYSTPAKLTQSYIVCPLESKLNMLWSFIRNHIKHKIIVFLASCKQVRFFYESFSRLHPGVTLLNLHGNMDQLKRMAVYDQFCRKQHAVLLATDIAARGLDFPAVDWVVQLDCPEDATTYIHRVGRTARIDHGGESLLVLLPSEEESMLEELQLRKIPITNIEINPKKLYDIERRMEALLASDQELKTFAQRAFVSYIKCIHMMKNKKIFNVKKLDLNAFSKSLGLAIAPRVRFLEKREKAAKQTRSATPNDIDMAASVNYSHDRLGEDSFAKDSMQLNNVSGFDVEGDEDKDDDFLTVKNNKRKTVEIDVLDDDEEIVPPSHKRVKGKQKITKAALAKRIIKKKLTVNSQVVFNDEGQPVVDVHKHSSVKLPNDSDVDDEVSGGITIQEAKKRMEKEDEFDKQLFRKKVKQKHMEKRIKEKRKRVMANQKQRGEEEELEVQLAKHDDSANDISDDE